MAAKNKKVLLQNLNTMVLNTLFANKDDVDITLADLRKQWESQDFQKN